MADTSISEEFTLDREDGEPQSEGVQAVIAGLRAYNQSRVGPLNWQPVRYVLRDGEGTVTGGVICDTYLGWMFVSTLWVSEALRGQGWGARLLRRAEDEARALGCHSVWLDTFSFHAPEFYRKQGYEEFGHLDGYPEQHRRYFFQKRLDG